MSALIASRPKALTINVRQRAQRWLSPLNLHWAGLGLLALVNLYLLLHMAYAYQQAKSQDANAVAKQEVALRTAEIAAKPLQGLDAKLAEASSQADAFYLERFPIGYSEFAAEIGRLARQQNVRLTRVQYAPKPVIGEAAGQLTEVLMDASLTGDYGSLVLFLNKLERDQLFFLISSVTLTGQQSGSVNLRVRITTYLRGTVSEEERQRNTIAGDPEDDDDAAPAKSTGAAR